MQFPCAFDRAFLDDCPYDPEVLLVDRLLMIDSQTSTVRCSWSTTDTMPITRSQRAHPVRHPRHVAGALMVHCTGMLGFVHAYHVLGLRHAEGWVGYGTHVHRAVFRKLVEPGEAIECDCRAVRSRLGQVRHFIRYAFEFRHRGEVCYEGEQSAVWLKVDATPAGLSP
jgi:3-hydroxymyristoyl/3-hydroxydecanoyl-(acyl carrier protein) dehydratase